MFTPKEIKVLSPTEPDQRGAQLSISLQSTGKEVFDKLTSEGVIVDWREPNLDKDQSGVIRVAPTPLYNTYEDVFKFVHILHKAIN